MWKGVYITSGDVMVYVVLTTYRYIRYKSTTNAIKYESVIIHYVRNITPCGYNLHDLLCYIRTHGIA
jgi:hypothetical protein